MYSCTTACGGEADMDSHAIGKKPYRARVAVLQARSDDMLGWPCCR
jgi:hypothetical protein